MISFTEAGRRLWVAQQELDAEEIAYIKKRYPKGLNVGSLMWLAWHKKIHANQERENRI